MIFKEIETERLLLKNIGIEDLDFIFSQFSDPSVTKYLYDNEPVKTLDEAMDIINMYILQEVKENHRWIIILKEENYKIGTCGFHCYDKTKNKIELGYDLKESYWNKGIMTEAIHALLGYAKDVLDIEYIEACVSIDNINSSKFVEKLGFKIIGSMNETFRNREYPHNIYSLKL